MPNPGPSLAASVAALVLASAHAQAQYSNAWAFGDSLSDAGQYGARFTTNPGLTFPMYVSQRYGIAMTPSFQGGTDYGQGGARVNSPSADIPPGAPNLSIAQQVSAHLAKGPLDPNGLYQLQGGANDILTLATQAAAGQITPAQLQAGVTQAAIDLAAQAARLQAAGARYLVVYGVPDAGKTPAAAAQNAQATLTTLSSLFNSTLAASLAAAKVQVIPVDQFTLLQEIVANPGAFGFVNVTTPVCTTASALQCTPATLRDPNGNLTYAFADGIHPTTGLALIGAAAAASMIEGPAQMSSLAYAPLAVYEANFRAIDARMTSGINSPRPMRKYEMWAAYDYSQNDIDGPFLSGKADLNTIAVGGDIKLSERMIAGASFGYTENEGDFGGGAGDYKLRETAGNVYVGYGMGPWYIGGVVGGANLDYGTARRFQLGALSRTESGDTTGWQYWVSLLGGYWFNPTGNWQHGPFGRLTYQEVKVNGFSENGSSSTTLSYGKQEIDSFVTSVGWQATGRLGMFRPFGRITWEYESKNNQSVVTARPVGSDLSYTIPGITPDDSYGRYLIGASADIGSVTGFLTGAGTFSNSNGDSYAITVGVRIPL
jgi:outer membrane lipase/esterase